MVSSPFNESSSVAPIQFLAESTNAAVLAIITGIEGPSYRPLGAVMALDATGVRVGSLSSGCVESDIALHALEALETGAVKVLRYGAGSPYVDIQLPCGGGLEITLLPNPDRDVLRVLVAKLNARTPCSLAIQTGCGTLSVGGVCKTGREAEVFHVNLEPEIFFYVFGKGPEAISFAALVQSAGFPNVLCSPDKETLQTASHAGNETQHMTSARFPAELSPDAFSAVVLFFHDHDFEPPILEHALQTPAFYVGAQGSQRAAAARRAELVALGVKDADLARLRGPIGLIPSTRDARKLAVSVLAEVMNES